MLSKTPRVESEALAITGIALEIKAEIERNCGNRCRTSNERGNRGCAAVLIVSGRRAREIDAGAEGIGVPVHAFDILHH